MQGDKAKLPRQTKLEVLVSSLRISRKYDRRLIRHQKWVLQEQQTEIWKLRGEVERLVGKKIWIRPDEGVNA